MLYDQFPSMIPEVLPSAIFVLACVYISRGVGEKMLLGPRENVIEMVT